MGRTVPLFTLQCSPQIVQEPCIDSQGLKVVCSSPLNLKLTQRSPGVENASSLMTWGLSWYFSDHSRTLEHPVEFHLMPYLVRVGEIVHFYISLTREISCLFIRRAIKMLYKECCPPGLTVRYLFGIWNFFSPYYHLKFFRAVNLVLPSGFPKAEKSLKQNPERPFSCQCCPLKFLLLSRPAKKVSLLSPFWYSPSPLLDALDQCRYTNITKAREVLENTRWALGPPPECMI